MVEFPWDPEDPIPEPETEVPTTPIPPAPRHQDILIKMLIEEQRVLIGGVIEVCTACYDVLWSLFIAILGIDATYEEIDDWRDASTLENHHETKIFPDPPGTNLYVRFTAGGTNNTFGDWAEIEDSAAAKLTPKFQYYPGYIVSVITEDFSRRDEVYLFELAYGETVKTTIGRSRVQGATLLEDTAMQERMRTLQIPAGEKVYYRMACETADATLDCHIRYYLTPGDE